MREAADSRFYFSDTLASLLLHEKIYLLRPVLLSRLESHLNLKARIHSIEAITQCFFSRTKTFRVFHQASVKGKSGPQFSRKKSLEPFSSCLALVSFSNVLENKIRVEEVVVVRRAH